MFARTICLGMMVTGIAAGSEAQTVLSHFCMTDGPVYAIAVSGNSIYIGGNFTYVGPNVGSGVSRLRIAAIDATTGQPTSWNPGSDGIVYAIALSGSTIYVGGDFTYIGGERRNRIAALTAGSNQATSWNPNANSFVYALAVSGSTVFAGGLFTNIGGASRSDIAALSAATGTALSWNPGCDQSVRSLALSGSTLYVGGQFTYIGGQSRSYIAAISTTTGVATSWNPGCNSFVFSLALSGSTLYAGGSFHWIGGQPRNNVAAFNISSGTLNNWNPNASGVVRTLAADGEYIYCGGQFHDIGGKPRNLLGAVFATSGLASSWDPNSQGIVYALAVSGSTIYAGGDFRSMAGVSRTYFAAIVDAALPVQLAEFRAQAAGATCVHLDWMTLSETNNYGFQVERRYLSEMQFTPLRDGFVPGHGTTIEAHRYSFTDSAAQQEIRYYRLKQMDLEGSFHFSDTVCATMLTGIADETPKDFMLWQNYPNPFNPSTTIGFILPIAVKSAQVAIYNVLGQLVWERAIHDVGAGRNEIVWTGESLSGEKVASGVYIYRLVAGEFKETKRMMLQK